MHAGMRLITFNRSREEGNFQYSNPIGLADNLKKKIYSSLKPNSSNSDTENVHGGIFNLEFSETSNILVAGIQFYIFIFLMSICHHKILYYPACEKKQFFLIDPKTRYTFDFQCLYISNFNLKSMIVSLISTFTKISQFT